MRFNILAPWSKFNCPGCGDFLYLVVDSFRVVDRDTLPFGRGAVFGEDEEGSEILGVTPCLEDEDQGVWRQLVVNAKIVNKVSLLNRGERRS